MTNQEIIALAKEAQKNSYSPYSSFPVGAVVICKDGSYFFGANIENSSYPLTICAERTALYNAYNHGYKKEDFVALALIANTSDYCAPCGACRQVISELFPSDAKILMARKDGQFRETTIEELLPFAFSTEDLKSAK